MAAGTAAARRRGQSAPDRPPKRRVAVTGLGVVSCCGTGLDDFFAGLCGPAPEGAHLAAGFDPATFIEDAKELRRTDRFAQLAVAAASMAVEDAGGLDPGHGGVRAGRDRTGVVFGAGVGGLETLQEQFHVLFNKGPDRVSPFFVPMMMANAGAAKISMRFGLRGPCETVVTACAAGTQAIGNAYRLIAYGVCDAMVAGGSEAAMRDVAGARSIGIAAFSNMTALSSTGRSRPFDVRRDGFVLAEGGAALVLEDLAGARARGARIYAEVLGTGSTADAHHITAPAPEGAGARLCMEVAIADAGLEPADIAHVNAHGTSTPANDLAEAQALEKVFGLPGPLVTSIKGVTGHALAGAGALEAVACALSLDRRLIPPTAGLEQLDPEIHLDVVTGTPRPFEPGPVLSNSFGFGGHNGCIVLAPVAS